jgi:hypothetical protein
LQGAPRFRTKATGLAAGNRYLAKAEQDPAFKRDDKGALELD